MWPCPHKKRKQDHYERAVYSQKGIIIDQVKLLNSSSVKSSDPNCHLTVSPSKLWAGCILEGIGTFIKNCTAKWMQVYVRWHSKQTKCKALDMTWYQWIYPSHLKWWLYILSFRGCYKCEMPLRIWRYWEPQNPWLHWSSQIDRLPIYNVNTRLHKQPLK